MSSAEAAGSQKVHKRQSSWVETETQQPGGLLAPPTPAVPVPTARSSTLARKVVPCAPLAAQCRVGKAGLYVISSAPQTSPPWLGSQAWPRAGACAHLPWAPWTAYRSRSAALLPCCAARVPGVSGHCPPCGCGRGDCSPAGVACGSRPSRCGRLRRCRLPLQADGTRPWQRRRLCAPRRKCCWARRQPRGSPGGAASCSPPWPCAAPSRCPWRPISTTSWPR